MQMYTNKETKTTKTKETSEEKFSWNEYSHYHDYFVELLSYNQKHNYTTSNIWDFCYV